MSLGAAAALLATASASAAATSAKTWNNSTIAPHLNADHQNGWVAGWALRDDRQFTVSLPGIDKSGGVCRAGYGIYSSAGTAVTTGNEGGIPKKVKGIRKCSKPLSSKTTTFIPASSSNAKTLTGLKSGTYYVNGWEQTGWDYQHSEFVWIRGGSTKTAAAPVRSSVKIRIDNTAVAGKITSPISATTKVTRQPQLTLTATESYSGIKSISCQDNVAGKEVALWSPKVKKGARAEALVIPAGFFPDDGVSTIMCGATNEVGSVSTLGSVKLELVPATDQLKATIAVRGHKVTATSGKKATTLSTASANTVTISGTLRDTQAGQAGAIKNAGVIVIGTLRVNGRRSVVRTVKTNSKGEFTVRFKGSASRMFSIAYDRSKYLASARAGALVRTSTATTITAPRTFSSGKTVTFSGQVKGGYVPRSGLTVHLQYRTTKKWAAVRGVKIRTSSTGKWRCVFKDDATVGLTYKFRVAVWHQNGWGYDGSSSPALTRTIH